MTNDSDGSGLPIKDWNDCKDIMCHTTCQALYRAKKQGKVPGTLCGSDYVKCLALD